MPKKKLIATPVEDYPVGKPPAGYKGGPGVYDGEEDYPKRTPTPNGPPEKVRDGSAPLPSRKG